MHEIDFVMLGNRIAATRHLRGIRQYELAKQTDVHPVTLSRLEHGNLPGVTLVVIARIAMALDVSLDALLDWHPQASSNTPPVKRQRTRKTASVDQKRGETV